MLTLLLKGVKKKFKNILIEDLFDLPPVSLTPVVHLKLRISPRIFEKIRWDTLGRGGNCFMKKPEVENLVTLSL
jgi:hypothetical protein